MTQDEFSPDELEIIEGWRVIKQHRKGYMHVTIQSQGNEFFLEITPGKHGKVHHRFKKEML